MRLRRRRWRAAEELVRDYVLEVDAYWTGAMTRQAEKLHRKVAALERDRGWTREDVVARLLELVRDRHPDPPPAVYVTGLGSSGSHWLAGMLGELDDFVDVGEVYVSAALRDAMEGLRTRSERLFVADAVQLLHGMPSRPDVRDACTVNSAAGAYELALYRSWDPRCVVVYLHRDPRDQVLSATFRKDEYRRYQAPDADDRAYLLRMCRRNRADHQRYLAVDGSADLEVAYERLGDRAVTTLGAIAVRAGRPQPDAALEEAAGRHDASAIRAGAQAPTGNLDLGGVSEGWRRDADRATRELVHTELAEVVASLGYPLVECLAAGDDRGEPVRWDDPRAATASVVCAAGAAAVDDAEARRLLAAGPRVLDLSRTGVTDDLVEDLARSATLEVLGLAGTATSEQGRRRLTVLDPDLLVVGGATPST